MISAALLDKSDLLDKAALRAMLLARIADKGGATRTDLTKDIFPLVSDLLPQASWRTTLELDVAVLKSDAMITEKAGRLRATDVGVQETLAFVGGKAALPADWSSIKNGRLVAKALGLEKATKQRLVGLLKADALRGEIVRLAYGLKLKPPVSLAKIRSALAIVALERAFGNQITSGLGSGSGLSVKASRLLAGQLTHKRSDYGTDRRLIDVLAAEYLGVLIGDSSGLQAALARSLLLLDAGLGAGKAPERSQKTNPRRLLPKKSAAIGEQNGAVAVAPAPKSMTQMPDSDAGKPKNTAKLQVISSSTSVAAVPDRDTQKLVDGVKPDLVGFATAVLAQAQRLAKGWSGDRKAFISHVSESIRQSHPQWALSDIEFKCMLTEAQQAGSIILAYADLKDKRNIADVQASAISYKNTVWHYIRVEA